MTEPVLIGLCGRSGTGKGYVCRLFEELGIPSIDTDAVYREMTGPCNVLSPCMKELTEAFGDSILFADNSLNRPALSSIVFAEGASGLRQTLNRITHAHILRETMSRAKIYGKNGFPLVIIDAPLLFESGFDAMCRFTVCVTASTETSVMRVMKRDGISEEAARRRLAVQLTEEELIARCDFRVKNELHCETLRTQTAEIAGEIRRRVGDGG